MIFCEKWYLVNVLNLKYEHLVHNSANVVPLQVFGKFSVFPPYICIFFFFARILSTFFHFSSVNFWKNVLFCPLNLSSLSSQPSISLEFSKVPPLCYPFYRRLHLMYKLSRRKVHLEINLFPLKKKRYRCRDLFVQNTYRTWGVLAAVRALALLQPQHSVSA